MRRRNLVILIAVLLLIGIVGFYILLLYILSIQPKPPTTLNSSVELKLLSSGAADYGGERGASSKVIYLLTQVNGKYITDTNLSVDLYNSEVPRDIYLLDYSSPGFSGCTECDNLHAFTHSLEATLQKYGLLSVNSTINQIKITQLNTLTRRSILVVPTGKIPAQFIGLESGMDLNYLMSRGFVIIFLARDFDETFYMNSSIGRISPDQLSNYNISYQFKNDLSTCDGYNLQNPQFVISRNIVSCSMSYVRNGDGYLFVLPRSIDIGWANGELAGEDVGRLIYSLAWKEPLTTGSLTIPMQKINESNSINYSVFMLPSPYDSGWARIFVTTTTLNGTPMYFTMDRQITNPINGKMIHKPQAVGDERMLIDFELSENFLMPKDANISVVAYKDSWYVEKQPAQAIKIQTEYTFTSNFLVDLAVGNYTLRAEDDDGYVYAQSFLNVPPISLTMSEARWNDEPQVFYLSLNVPKYPIPTGTSADKLIPLSSKQVYVTINTTPGKDLLPPYSNVSDSNGAFVFMPSQPLAYGLYTFRVNTSRQILSINQVYPKPPSWFDNPLNVAIIIATVIIGIIAIALRRPEKPVYTIDVPDFPPLEKVIVPISKFSILSLFDSVNKEYKWSFMPLSPQELKNEMRKKITYKGVPILITDYNLDKILDELIESGDVVKSLNFYGLRTWEKKSGRDMRYLTLFRLLRNFFINNAIPFTDLNQRNDCDLLATVKGEGLYVHIYNDENTLKKVLELIGAGKNFVVFESRKELDEVSKKLDLSYNPLAVILKSEIGVGSIQLIHPGNFGEMIGR